MKTLLVLVALFASTTAFAAPPAGSRAAHQAARIRQGVAAGELTRAETVRLAVEQGRVRALAKRTKADGVVTRKEARRLDNARDAASAHIFVAKHNARSK